MDGMDGLALVRAIRKEHPQVPVILMTAHGSEDVAMEALRVGATDYVPKQRLAQELPAILARTLWTATSGNRRRLCLRSLVRRESEFELGNDPDVLPPLLEFLQDEMTQLDRWDSAELMRITIALDEALRNALFHGNLEVSSELREEDDRRFHELARQRAAQAPYRDRRIRIRIAHGPDQSRFVIRDEGPGFDTSRADRPIEPEDLLRPSGRGLLLMKSFMDSVSFNQAGNEVTLDQEEERRARAPVPRRARAESPRSIRAGIPSPHSQASRGGTTIAADGTEQGRHRRTAKPRGLALGIPRRMERCSCRPGCTSGCSISSTTPSTSSIPSGGSSTGTKPRSGSPAIRATRSSGGLASTGCWTTSTRPAASSATGIARWSMPWRKTGRCTSGCSSATRTAGGSRSRCGSCRSGTRTGAVIGGVEVFRDVTSTVVVESAYRQITGGGRPRPAHRPGQPPLPRPDARPVLSRLWAGPDQPLSLIMADLDHFKQVNDTWGHVVGDRALVRFAATLQNQCRPMDLVARYGGEEFVVAAAGASAGNRGPDRRAAEDERAGRNSRGAGPATPHRQLRRRRGRARGACLPVLQAGRRGPLPGQVAGTRPGGDRRIR